MMRKSPLVLCCLASLLALPTAGAAVGDRVPMAFKIKDLRHQGTISAGSDFADNNVYHLKCEEQGAQSRDPGCQDDASNWRFLPADDDIQDGSFTPQQEEIQQWDEPTNTLVTKSINVTRYYYIIDTRYEGMLVAGTTYDGQTYHKPSNSFTGRPEAMWEVVSISGQPSTYRIFDRKHGRALVAGDTHDRDLYHQVPGGRSNGQWKVVPQGGGEGPAFYATGRKVLHVEKGGARELDSQFQTIVATTRNLSREEATMEVATTSGLRLDTLVRTENDTSQCDKIELSVKVGFNTMMTSGEVGVTGGTERCSSEKRSREETFSRTQEFSIRQTVKVPGSTTVRAVKNGRVVRSETPITTTYRVEYANGVVKDVQEYGLITNQVVVGEETCIESYDAGGALRSPACEEKGPVARSRV